MALHWNWGEKMGTCTTQNGTELNLYRGNAFMIAIYEDNKTDTYQLAWFFVDKDHAKNCLGLTKGYEKVDFDWASFKLDKNYKETKQFIQMLVKSKAKVQITIY